MIVFNLTRDHGKRSQARKNHLKNVYISKPNSSPNHYLQEVITNGKTTAQC